MKTFTITMTSSTTATLTTSENGQTLAIEDCKLTKDTLAFELPPNELSRKWVMISKLTKAGGSLELTPHIERTITVERSERKGLEEYLDGDDKALYLELVAKAKANREAANKKAPMTELEKAQRRLEKAQAELARLQSL